jgi:hypothetical protein
VALSYGLSEMTVRSWLKREVTASSDILAMSRLERENEALYRLVGQLVYESSREKKVAVASASSNTNFGVAESRYEYQFCTYPQVSLVLGFKNFLKDNSYLKSATPKIG